MTLFLSTAFGFPTLVFSILLAFCLLYWLIAATGVIDADTPDGMLAADGDGTDTNFVAGMLSRLGIAGVPVMLVITVLSFVAWVLTYFAHLFVLRHLPDPLRWLGGIGALLAALLVGMLVASLLLRPLARAIQKLRPPLAASLLGRVGTVISPHADEHDGRAAFDDGGAGLILQIRLRAGQRLARGERIVILEHVAADNSYVVMSESEFRPL